MHQEIEQTAREIADLVPAVAINLRVAALFDTTGADLTTNQLITLLLVGQAEGARLRAGEIARSLGISAASATALVDRLVDAGMFERARGTDRRVVLISLTDKGATLIERLKGGTIVRIRSALTQTDPLLWDGLVESLRRVATFANQIADGDPAP